MKFVCKKFSIKALWLLLAGIVSFPASADQSNPSSVVYIGPKAQKHSYLLSRLNPSYAHPFFQFGAFNAWQGRAQNIGINGLIGDYFSVSRHNSQNFLLGLGYYVDAFAKDRVSVQAGLNAYYLAPTSLSGKVTQEGLFTNLSYHYSLINYPVYLASKALIDMNDPRYNVTLDLGIGPNIIQARNFKEHSLDGGVTLPDYIFRSQTKVAFSATAGIGFRFNNAGQLPIEIGYRFFYLGQGYLNKANNQVLNNLKTGNGYANALVVSISG